MKKLSIYLSIGVAIGLMSCGSKSEPKKDNPQDTTQQSQPADTNKTETTGTTEAVDPNSSPENAVKAMIESGKSGDYTQLAKLCNPAVKSDGDVKDICKMANGELKGDDAEEMKKDYNEFFGNATIKGAARIKGNEAEVDIETSAEGGDKETIGLIQVDGKWYLLGF